MKTLIKKLNDAFYLMGRVYHKEIPLEHILKLVKGARLIPIQEDGTPWEGFLCGSTGKACIELMRNDTKEILKKCLQLSWYRNASGNFEIIAYIL